ncbi:MAG: helix-turn-helix domain-containing protein [Oscillospiraceae bacterium]|nr:helix-turn-helix domain-containing protein [Oscillospiraceae bacterium]
MIGEKIKALRKQKGVTAKKVAEALNILPDTYRNYETGRREPNLETLSSIADYFKVSTDYLLGRETFPDPIDLLNLNPQEKAILYAYISLKPDKRSEFVEILKNIVTGADAQATTKPKQEEDDNDEYITYTTTIGAEMDRRKALEALQQAGKLDDTEAKKNAV